MIQLPPPYVASPARPEDIEAIWRVMRAANMAEAGRPGWGLAELENWLSGVPIVIGEDVMVVRHGDSHIVGVEIFHSRDPFVRPIVVGGVHPDHVGNGLGTALLAWARRRAVAQTPKAPVGAAVTFVGYTAAGHGSSDDLMLAAGFAESRYFIDMEVDFTGPPPAPEPPGGIGIRRFDPDSDLAGLARAHLESFQDHYGFVPTSEELQMEQLAHWMSSAEHDPGLWWVAAAGREIVGFNLCDGSSEGDDTVGFVSSLGVVRSHRGRGLGRALLLVAFGEFYRRGKRGASLGVDADSLTGATRLYESVGMGPAARYASWELLIREGTDLATTTPPADGNQGSAGQQPSR